MAGIEEGVIVLPHHQEIFERLGRGAKLGHLRHATQAELSEAEVRQRFEAVAQHVHETAQS